MQLALLLAIISACLLGWQDFGLRGGFWLALIIVSSVVMLGYRAEVKGNRLLIFLGDISYSLYLVHYSLMMFLIKIIPGNAPMVEKAGVFILSIAASIVLAFFMFEWVEKPFIRVGKKVASVLSAGQK